MQSGITAISGALNTSVKLSETKPKDKSSSIFPAGLPKWESRATLAPLLTNVITVGACLSILLISDISPSSSIGTLKSHLTKTTLPETSISAIVFNFIFIFP